MLLFHAALHHDTGDWSWLGLRGSGGMGSSGARDPPVDSTAAELWLPTVSKDEMAWNIGFLDVLLVAVSEALWGAGQPRIQARFAQDIAAAPLHCFAHLGLVGTATHDFGYFADVWEAQLFREAAWKRLALLPPPFPQPQPNAKMRTIVAVRRPGVSRLMLNRPEVLQMLRETGLVELEFDGGPLGVDGCLFEGASFREQLVWMQATDLLVAVHGGALNNAIFMRAGSAVIDVLPSNFVEFEWSNALTVAGMHYMFLPDREAGVNCEPHPAACREGRPYESGRMACLGIRNCDVNVWLGGLEIYVRQAAFLIRNVQRRVTKGPEHTTWHRGNLPDGRFDPLPPS